MIYSEPPFDRVPGEWRCLQCEARLSQQGTERPPCPAGCEKALVPLTWKRYGPELLHRLQAAEAACEEALALRERAVVMAEQAAAQLGGVSEQVKAAADSALAMSRRRFWTGLWLGLAGASTFWTALILSAWR